MKIDMYLEVRILFATQRGLDQTPQSYLYRGTITSSVVERSLQVLSSLILGLEQV